MKSVVFSLVAMTAIFALGTAAPTAEALPAALAAGQPALCDLPGPPTATLIPDITIAQLVSANPARSLLSKRASGTFQGFSGDRCDGDRGIQRDINNGPQCILASGRHSFSVLGCSAVVTLFELEGCRGRQNTVRVGQGCFNVNTGYNWGSSSVSCQ